MEAVRLQRIDREYYIHLEAWANREVNQTYERGKKVYYKYRKFKDFFDYEKLVNEDQDDKQSSNLTDLQKLLKEANK